MSETVTFDREEWEVFLRLLQQCQGRLSCAGCNDFEVPDSPVARELAEKIGAAWYELPLEEWRRHEDYEPPRVANGLVVFRDDFLCGFFLDEMNRQVFGERAGR